MDKSKMPDKGLMLIVSGKHDGADGADGADLQDAMASAMDDLISALSDKDSEAAAKALSEFIDAKCEHDHDASGKDDSEEDY